MPRPKKCRQILEMPSSTAFTPIARQSVKRACTAIAMPFDEYECIRLIDFEGFSQEKCAEMMGVSRTTVQGIYAQARRKLASFLVEARPLIIEGGDYVLSEQTCPKMNCKRKRWNHEQSE